MTRVALFVAFALTACTAQPHEPVEQVERPSSAAVIPSGAVPVAPLATTALRVEAGRDTRLPADNVRSYAVEPADVAEVRSTAEGLSVHGVRVGDAQINLVGRDDRRSAFVVTVTPAAATVAAAPDSVEAAPPAPSVAPRPRPKAPPPNHDYGF